MLAEAASENPAPSAPSRSPACVESRAVQARVADAPRCSSLRPGTGWSVARSCSRRRSGRIADGVRRLERGQQVCRTAPTVVLGPRRARMDAAASPLDGTRTREMRQDGSGWQGPGARKGAERGGRRSSTKRAPTGSRVDQWLDIACLFKTRSEAQKACRNGKVEVNHQAARPHRLLHAGDEVRITRAAGTPPGRRRARLRRPPRPEGRGARSLRGSTPPPTPEELETRRLLRAARPQTPRGPSRRVRSARRGGSRKAAR